MVGPLVLGGAGLACDRNPQIIEDAAAATVVALECEPGVYNVVDDQLSELYIWLPAFAR
jgi:hypothetical protein